PRRRGANRPHAVASMPWREGEEPGSSFPALLPDNNLTRAADHILALVVTRVGVNVQRAISIGRSGFRLECEIHASRRFNACQDPQRTTQTLVRLHKVERRGRILKNCVHDTPIRRTATARSNPSL